MSTTWHHSWQQGFSGHAAGVGGKQELPEKFRVKQGGNTQVGHSACPLPPLLPFRLLQPADNWQRNQLCLGCWLQGIFLAREITNAWALHGLEVSC